MESITATPLKYSVTKIVPNTQSTIITLPIIAFISPSQILKLTNYFNVGKR